VLLDINQIPQLVRELQLRPWPMLQLLSFTAKPTSSHGGSSSSNIQAWSAEVPAGAFVKDHQNDRWRTLIYLQSSRVFCQPLFCRTSVTPFKTFQFLPGYLPILYQYTAMSDFWGSTVTDQDPLAGEMANFVFGVLEKEINFSREGP